jgi:hypothetical protein
LNYRLLLPLILLCSAFPIHAQERWFEIELLLFQRNVDIEDIQEDLASENGAVDTANSIPLFKTQTDKLCVAEPCLHESNPVLINSALFDPNAHGFQLLDASHLQLTPQREKLSRHALFTPVLHLAWRMPVASEREAIPLHIFAGKNLALNMPQARSDKKVKSVDNAAVEIESNQLDQDLVSNIVNEQVVPLTDKWEIDGNVKIYLDHYLFIDSQLLIREEVTQDVAPLQMMQEQGFEIVNSENDVQVIKQTDTEKAIDTKQETVIKEILFDQNRRLRSEEIHYFDHPLMGIILQIRKIE